MGVFRSVQKPTYDAMMADQLEVARTDDPADLDALLAGNDTWTVKPELELVRGEVPRPHATRRRDPQQLVGRRRCRW